MPTVQEVARIAIAESGSDVSALFASEYVNLRWKELASKYRLKHLRQSGELQLIAQYNTGTATATRNSATVSGASTVWTTSMVGRHFRGREAWYRITQVQSATSLILETLFSENTLTAGSYTIVQRFYDLPKEVKHVGRIWSLMRLNRHVHLISKDDMDILYPSRNTLSYPRHVAEIGIDRETKTRLFEFYPYVEDDSEIVHYPYWEDPPKLGYREQLPGYISEHILKEGVIASLLRQSGLKAIKSGQNEAGTLLLNEGRRQETFWRGKMIEAIIDEGAIDDSSFVIDRGRGNRLRDDPIQNAYDLVWNRSV